MRIHGSSRLITPPPPGLLVRLRRTARVTYRGRRIPPTPVLKALLKAPVAALIAALLFPVALSAQTPPDRIRVHVLPIENLTGQAQFDAVGTTVSDTVALTLRLLGSYEISQGRRPTISDRLPLPADPTQRHAALTMIAETLDVENLVYGEILPGGAGGGAPAATSDLPRIRLAVYDRLSETTTVEEERTPTSLFDVFSVTDELAADVLSGFSGRRVTFGSIRIAPSIAEESGTEGAGAAEAASDDSAADASSSGTGSSVPTYRVILDGEPLGANLRSIDSILTGTHRVVITIEVLGESRVLFDAMITVEENRATVLTVLLPAIDMEQEVADASRRRRDAELAAALAALAEEQERLETVLSSIDGDQLLADPGDAGDVPVARDLFLHAAEYLDPQAVRDAATANARLAAEYRHLQARRLFAERRPTDAVARQEAIVALAQTFSAEDLLGHREDIAWTVGRFGELMVQRELTPRTLVPSLLFGSALVLSLPMSYVDAGPPQGQNVPLVPLMIVASGTALWNATDWDYRHLERSLRRYGRSGLLAAANDRPRHRWELAVGIGATVGSNGFDIETGPIAQSYGVETVELANGTLGVPSLRLRYWRSPSFALGGELQIGSVGGSEELVSLAEDFEFHSGGTDNRNYVELEVNQLFLVMVGGSYTRTGRTLLESGLSFRLLDYSTGNLRYEADSIQEEVYEELLGGTTSFVAVPGVTAGIAFRLGRGTLPPWEAGLTYRLERLAFPNGTLAEDGPYYVTRYHVALRRSIYFGEPVGADTGADAVRPVTASTARATAEERWRPQPLLLYADPAGALIRGARIGLEYIVDPQWTVGAHVRWGGAGMGSFLGLAKEIPARVEYHWPGISARWYQRPQNGPPSERMSGWYIGGILEYADFDLPPRRDWYADSLELSGRSEQVDSGSLWFLLADGGYRIPLGRASFLDLGVQAGVRFGQGYESTTTEYFDNGSEQVLEEASIGAGSWVYPTVAIGTRLY